MQRSETIPIPKDQLLDVRETNIECQKSKKKVLYKDNWRTEKKRSFDNMEEFWKGKKVYKIKKDYVIPDDVVRSDTDRQAKLFRGNIDDLLHPESASSSEHFRSSRCTEKARLSKERGRQEDFKRTMA